MKFLSSHLQNFESFFMKRNYAKMLLYSLIHRDLEAMERYQTSYIPQYL